ncbi:50S ribosomal protein L25 [Candidatus Parcubacteria bacterium]|nr:MAG: 50S ribosomal protein L25 [Candidatus Parcubacteria bacterium]
MTQKIVLNAKKRESGEKISEIKEAAGVPAVIYGQEYENMSLKVNSVELDKIYGEAGSSAMIDLKVDSLEKPVKVIIKDLQYNHKNQIIHVDFYKIDESKKLSTSIALEFIGESEAVEVKKGILLKNMDAINVECSPADLVSHFDVDISVLKEVGDTITVADLKISEAYTIANDSHDSVATVVEQKKEVEEEPVETAEATEEGKEEVEKAEGEDKKEE